jgi:hypothetical protein
VAHNVLGVIHFDRYWIYVLAVAGWEGSAHDEQVFNNALLRGLPAFEGNITSGAGYALHQYVMVISRNGRKPMNVLKMQKNFSI